MTPNLRLRYAFFERLFATRMRRMAAMTLTGLLIAAVATVGVWGAFQSAGSAAPPLAALLPQGALLTIEAKDFAGLLKRWNDSPEKTAWLKSDNYSVFSRSRLLGRLSDAQNEFAKAAGLPPDMSFLNEVAGSESVFAWYDIGKLEFLYITHMPSGSADKTRLVQMRGKFTTRQIGSQTFYVRTQGDQGQDSQGQARTVAFATSGDWLLLATREDLMAGALTLLAANSSNPTAANSVAAESWFMDARAAAAKEPGELRMTLNLEKIVPTPYFRSYWIQRNITEMRQYRSAVADLHTEAGVFREERVLLPKSPADTGASNPSLAALVALLPQHAGVYRAIASPSVDSAIESLNEKLIQRQTGAFNDTRIAPDADVAVHGAGSTSDLETRIDTAPVAPPVKSVEPMTLQQALADSGLNAMMTVSRTNEAADGIWVPFQSAVVLSSAKDWDASAMQAAIQQAMQTHFTTSGLGVAWKAVKTKGGSYFEISDTRPLEMAVRGKVCILTDDSGLMLEMLGHLPDSARGGEKGRRSQSKAAARPEDDEHEAQATLIAGFDFPQERASFARWSALVDRTGSGAAGQNGEPSFFSQNMRSLSDAFAGLESERVEERRDGSLTRQTVTYAWQH